MPRGDEQVKIFRVEGRMLIKHDKFPMWWRFRKEIRADAGARHREGALGAG